jgi:hypothetical protein
MTDQLRKDWLDIGFVAVAIPRDASCDFVAYRASDVSGKIEFEAMQDDGNAAGIDDMGQASIYLDGYVKWDHCSNWAFRYQDRAMLHFCEREQAAAIGILLARLYDWARELIPEWDTYGEAN